MGLCPGGVKTSEERKGREKAGGIQFCSGLNVPKEVSPHKKYTYIPIRNECMEFD